MYPAEVLSRILAVQPVLDSVERDQAAPRAEFDLLTIGQSVTGLVKSQAKGVSLVEIDGQTVAMRLPQPVATGDTLRLRFAGHMPQPVFLLDTPQSTPTDKPQLSQTARMLNDIMLRVPERSLPTLTPPGPLLDQPTANPAEMALALRTALVRSGLFYESHLANWTVGLDSFEGLMQEPQNRQAADAAHAPASAVTALALTNTSEPAEPKAANPMHTLLTQQLQVLESPHFIWRGELWPGQMLEWQVGQDTDPQADESAATRVQAEEAGWESHLKLSLPTLGTLNVHIKLDARQAFSIRMVPQQAEVEPLLLQNQGRLIEQLAAAGCTLQTLTVLHDAGA